jgi:predicted ArsR family transcriptional regulator
MNSNTSTQKARLFKLLAKGTEVTIAEATQRLSIANPSAVVAQLREDGLPIYTNRRKNAQGQTVFKYRLDTKALASA